MADLGGLSSALFAVLTALSTAITHRIVIAKFIKRFYSDNQGNIYALYESSEPTYELEDIDDTKTID